MIFLEKSAKLRASLILFSPSISSLPSSRLYVEDYCRGRMAEEWSNAAVLKTARPENSSGGSNPSPSAII